MSMPLAVKSLLALCGASVPEVLVQPFVDYARNDLTDYGCDTNDDVVWAYAVLEALSSNDITNPCIGSIISFLMKRCPAWAQDNLLF
jgi:hypothetical protein